LVMGAPQATVLADHNNSCRDHNHKHDYDTRNEVRNPNIESHHGIATTNATCFLIDRLPPLASETGLSSTFFI
jgi:hypothetical protein